MEAIARVYAEALFESAKEAGKLDVIKEQLDQFADALSANRELQRSSSAPTSPRPRRRTGWARRSTAPSPSWSTSWSCLAEKHRLPVIFRIRDRFDDLWDEENKRLEVTVTSAVELDPELVERIGQEIEKQTGQTVELRSVVDPDVLGGLVLQVGNKVLDASVRNRLDKIRKSVAAAA